MGLKLSLHEIQVCSACSSSECTYLNSKLGNSPDHSKHIQKPPRRINANTEGYFCSFESSQSAISTFKDTTLVQTERNLASSGWSDLKPDMQFLIFNPPPFKFLKIALPIHHCMPNNNNKILEGHTLIVPSNKTAKNIQSSVFSDGYDRHLACGTFKLVCLTIHKNQFRE